MKDPEGNVIRFIEYHGPRRPFAVSTDRNGYDFEVTDDGCVLYRNTYSGPLDLQFNQIGRFKDGVWAVLKGKDLSRLWISPEYRSEVKVWDSEAFAQWRKVHPRSRKMPDFFRPVDVEHLKEELERMGYRLLKRPYGNPFDGAYEGEAVYCSIHEQHHEVPEWSDPCDYVFWSYAAGSWAGPGCTEYSDPRVALERFLAYVKPAFIPLILEELKKPEPHFELPEIHYGQDIYGFYCGQSGWVPFRSFVEDMDDYDVFRDGLYWLTCLDGKTADFNRETAGWIEAWLKARKWAREPERRLRRRDLAAAMTPMVDAPKQIWRSLGLDGRKSYSIEQLRAAWRERGYHARWRNLGLSRLGVLPFEDEAVVKAKLLECLKKQRAYRAHERARLRAHHRHGQAV